MRGEAAAAAAEGAAAAATSRERPHSTQRSLAAKAPAAHAAHVDIV
jgi:hypothetical protein